MWRFLLTLILFPIRLLVRDFQERVFDRLNRRLKRDPEAVTIDLLTILLVGDVFYFDPVLQDRTVELTFTRPGWWPSFGNYLKLPTLTSLRYLYKLDCSGCYLSALPELPASLGILSCQNNRLTDLPNLKNVQILLAKRNRLATLDAKVIRVFDLRENRITRLPFPFDQIDDCKIDRAVVLTLDQRIKRELIRHRETMTRLMVEALVRNN